MISIPLFCTVPRNFHCDTTPKTKINGFCDSLPFISLGTSGHTPKSVGALIPSSDQWSLSAVGPVWSNNVCAVTVVAMWRISSCPLILQWFLTSSRRCHLSFVTTFSASRPPPFSLFLSRAPTGFVVVSSVYNFYSRPMMLARCISRCLRLCLYQRIAE